MKILMLIILIMINIAGFCYSKKSLETMEIDYRAVSTFKMIKNDMHQFEVLCLVLDKNINKIQKLDNYLDITSQEERDYLDNILNIINNIDFKDKK